MDKQEALKLLEMTINGCNKCWEQEWDSKRFLMGMGNPDAQIMCIGESPSPIRIGPGIPFGGNIEKIFDETLRAIGEQRENIWATNAIKCTIPGKFIGNYLNCRKILFAEMYIVNPTFVICFGHTAWKTVFGEKAPRIRFGEYIRTVDGKIFLLSFHPSAIRRAITREQYFEIIKLIKIHIDTFHPGRKGSFYVSVDKWEQR